MSNPFRENPADKWAKSYKKAISRASTRFSDPQTKQEYINGIRDALPIYVDENSKAVEAFEEAQDAYGTYALKRITILTAAEELRDNGFRVSYSVKYGVKMDVLDRIKEIRQYDDVEPTKYYESVGDIQYNICITVLANKYVSNWADAYK